MDRVCLVRRNLFFRYVPGQSAVPAPGRLPSGAVVMYPCPRERIAFATLPGGEAEDRRLESHMNRGDRLGVILIDGRVAHRALVQSTGYAAAEEDPRALLLRPGQLYVHYCRTDPAYSRQGLYTAMLRHILCQSGDDPNIREVAISCHGANLPSVRGIVRAGFEYVKSSIAFNLFDGQIRFHWSYRGREPRAE